jgi:hypothetical protein
MESMRNVVLSVGKKPVLSSSLVLDLLTFVTSFVMAVYLLASLPAPFPQSYVKVARDRVDAMWWTLLAGGIILLFYRRVDLQVLSLSQLIFVQRYGVASVLPVFTESY